MAGSWEMRDSVVAATLHTDTTTMAWSLGLRKLQPYGMPIMALAGMPYDMARNVACMRALEHGFDWLFFLDSDVVPPPDAVPRLMAHRQPIVSGVYHRRSPPAGIPVMMKPVGQWLTRYPANKVIEVDVVGAGCLLIHRDVLQNMPPQSPGRHWFDWRVDEKGLPTTTDERPPLSEDFTFCMWAKKHGYRILVDTSVQCQHIGLAQASYASFEPCTAM